MCLCVCVCLIDTRWQNFSATKHFLEYSNSGVLNQEYPYFLGLWKPSAGGMEL